MNGDFDPDEWLKQFSLWRANGKWHWFGSAPPLPVAVMDEMTRFTSFESIHAAMEHARAAALKAYGNGWRPNAEKGRPKNASDTEPLLPDGLPVRQSD